MSRATLHLKPQRPPNAEDCPECEGWLHYSINNDCQVCAKCGYEKRDDPRFADTSGHKYPAEWIKGQLLNNRNMGNYTYVITLLGEEFDPQHPERAIHFSDSHTCQTFLSWWYSRDNVDGRAG